MTTSRSFTRWFNVFRVLVTLSMVFSQFGWTAGKAIAAPVYCFVDASAAGANTGNSWGDAFTDLQSALGGSNCTEVWVADGTYKPTTGTDRNATFQLKNGVAIYGGFAGDETVREARDPAANLTILSGDLDGDDNSNVSVDEPTRDDNSYHVVTSATGATLDGFTITAGNANGSACPNTGCGGGMLNYQSSPTLTNLIFSSNSAWLGGGMENYDHSNPMVTNTTFSGNTASGYGGGMNNGYSSPKVTNVTFNGNSAVSGGGMANVDLSSPMVTNATFSGNTDSGDGGGMLNNYTSKPTIRNTILWGNSGTQVYNVSGDSIPVMSYSVVQGGCPSNSDCTGGGIIDADPKLLALADNGGYTETMALGEGSSAIDTGNDTFCEAAVGAPDYGAGGLDQRGVARPQGSHCDIGAFEVEVPPVKIGLVTAESGITDNSFNEMAYEGLVQAETDLGVDGTIYTPTDSSEYAAKLQACINDGNELCIAVGFGYGVSLATAAKANPSVKFGIVDYSYPDCWEGAVEGTDCGSFTGIPNVRGMEFDDKQAGYLAGALAGKMTNPSNNMVGAVAGMEIPPVVAFAEGYRNGAQCANANVNVLINYTGSFTDPDLGRTTAQDLMSQGADVIFGVGGETGNGGILYAAQHGGWSIGVDTDQYVTVFENGGVTGSGNMLTSAMKHVDTATYDTIGDYVGGTFTPGIVGYNLASDGVGLAPYHETDDDIPSLTKDYVNGVKAGILAGTININDNCRTELWYSYESGSGEEDALKAVVANTETHFGTKINIEQHPSDKILDDYINAVKGGGGPEILLYSSDVLLNMVSENVVLNLDPHLGEIPGVVSTAAIDNNKVNGQLYGIPESAKAVALYYHKSSVPTPPSTTEGLKTLVEGGMKLAGAGQGGAGAYWYYGFWNAFGGELMNTDGVCIADKTPGFEAALQYLKDLQDGGADLLTDYGTGQDKFLNGGRDMWFNGPWALGDYENQLGSDLGVVLLPTGPAGVSLPMAGTDGFFVNSNVLDPVDQDELVDLILYMTNHDNSLIFTNAGHIPVRSDVISSDPLINTFYQVSVQSDPRPNRAEMEGYWKYFGWKIEEVLSGNVSPHTGVIQACQLMNESNGFTPVIEMGDETWVTMSTNGTPIPFDLTLHATPPGGSGGGDLTWSISAAASHGLAGIADGSGTDEVISYTPTTDYTGTDQFEVKVAIPSGMYDVILVNVNVGAGSISGTIKDADGNPFKAPVRAVLVSDGSEAASTWSSDVDGSYSLNGLPLDAALAVVASDEDPDIDGYGGRYFNNVSGLDWAESITITSGSPTRGGVDIKLSTVSVAVEHLTFNVRPTRILNDVRIRQAIAFGTDRQAILDYAFVPRGQTGEVLNAMVLSGLWYTAPAIDPPMSLYPYNPTEAGNLLNLTDYNDFNIDGYRVNDSGGELALDFYTTLAPARADSAALFTAQMKDIGIRINIHTTGDLWGPTGPLVLGIFDITEFAWVLDDSDALFGVFNSGNEQNYGGYSNSTLDSFFDAARAAKIAGNPSTFETNALDWQYESSEDLPALPMFTRISAPPPPATPVFNVSFRDNWVNAWNWKAGNNMHLTVDDDGNLGNGGICYEADSGIDGGGSAWFNVDQNKCDLVVGQWITLSDSVTTKNTQIQDVHFDTIDQTTDTAMGRGPNGAEADVYIRTQTGEEGQHITIADTGGNWSVVFNGLHPIQNLQDANIVVYDNDGDGTQSNFDASFATRLSEKQVHGYNWKLGTPVTIHITGPGGDYTATRPAIAQDGNPGQTWVQFDLALDPGPGYFELQPGQVITMTDGHYTKVHTVNHLVITGIDVDLDTISGTADPGSYIEVGHICDETGCAIRRIQLAPGVSNWVADFGHATPGDVGGDEKQLMDIKPGTGSEARAPDIDWDTTNVNWRVLAPYVEAAPYSNWIHARDWPEGTPVTMTFDDPTTTDPGQVPDITELGTVEHNPGNPGDPNDIGAFFNWPGGFDPGPGYIITVTGNLDGSPVTKTLEVTDLWVVSADPASGDVSGFASAGAPNVEVCLNGLNNCSRHPVVDPISGAWTVNYSPDLKPGDNGWAAEYDPENDRTWYDWHVVNPWIQANPGSNWVQAYDWPDGAILSLTINNGVPFTATSEYPSWNPNQTRAWFDLNGGSFDLKAGDQLKITDDSIPPIERSYAPTNLAVTSINVDTDTVFGTGEPGIEVQVCLNIPNNCISRYVTPDAGDGSWSVHYSGIGNEDLRPGSNGWAAQPRDGGVNQTWADWSVPNPNFSDRATPNDEVDVREWPSGSTVYLEIYASDAMGSPLFEGNLVTDGNGNGSFGLNGVLDIQPGMFVKMTDGITIKTHTVTTLHFDKVDVDLDTVAGQAEVGFARVDVWVCPQGPGDCVNRNLTADKDGYFTANFHTPDGKGNPEFDIIPGTWIDSQEWDEFGERTMYGYTVPNGWISANDHSNWIQAHDWQDGTVVYLTINGLPTGSATIGSMPGGWMGAQFDHAVAVGDMISVSGAGLTKSLTVTALEVTSFDLVANTISGVKTVGAGVEVCANIPGDCIPRYVPADVSVPWTSPTFSPDFTLAPAANGWAAEWDTDGDATWYDWNIPYPGSVTVSSGDPIQLAASLDLSDGAADIGQSALKAIQMAVTDFGPVDGFAVQINEFDSLCGDETAGYNAATSIIANTQHVGVLGHVCSVSFRGGLPVYEGAAMVTISGSATMDSLPGYGPKVFNRTTIHGPFSDHWLTTIQSLPEVIAWSVDYHTLYGEDPDPYAVLYYDATMLMLQRIEEVGEVQLDGNLLIDRGALAEAVRNTTDYTGVSGPLSLDSQGNRIDQIEYTLTTNVVGNGHIERDKAGPYHYGDVVELNAVADTGWSFAGWSGDLGGSDNPDSILIDGDKLVTATFTQDCYALTLDHTGSGATPSANPTHSTGCDEGKYVYDQSIALSEAIPGAHWHISGWNGTMDNGSTADTNSVTMPNGAHSASVIYSQDEYTLTINLVGSGHFDRDNNGPYHYGDVVQLTAEADLGWTFSGWSGDLGGSVNPENITIDGNKTVTATFTQNVYTLTTTPVGNGHVERNNAGPYHYGDVVQLTAVADPGWIFSGWSGGLGGSENPKNITIDGNKSVTATFTKIIYKVYLPLVNK